MQDSPSSYQGRNFLETGEVIPGGRYQRNWHTLRIVSITIILPVSYKPVNSIFILISFIKTELKADKNKYEDTTSHSYRKAKYIDQRITFIFPKVSPGDFQVEFKHLCYFCYQRSAIGMPILK
jgi:hypothetical protein